MDSLRSSDKSDVYDDAPPSAPEVGGSGTGAVGFILCVIAALGFCIMAFFVGERPTLQLTLFVITAALLALAVLVVVWSGAVELRARALLDLPEAMLEINAKLADLEAVRREHYKMRAGIESFAKSIESEKALLSEMRDDVTDVLERTLDHHAEIERHRGESARRGRALEEWNAAAIEYIHTIERALAHSAELSPEAVKTYEKSIEDFARLLRPLGIDVIRPATGDEFNDRLHEAAEEEESATVPAGRVLSCKAWGIRSTSGTRRAQVVLAKRSKKPA